MKFNILQNDLRINLDSLLTIGYRANNSKRNFLFISKCLGKHIIVNPEIITLTGLLIGSQIYKKETSDWNLNELVSLLEYPYPKMKENIEYVKAKNKILTNTKNVLVMGFAETATAIGIPIAKLVNGYYITTSREPITSIKSCLNFEESHSHATSHKCFLIDTNKIKNAETIILIDDEITTGNTMLNLIKNIEKVFPNKNRKYIVASILDWRNDNYRNNFENFKKEMDLNLNVVSLISGTFENDDNTIYLDRTCELITEQTSVTNIKQYMNHTIQNTTFGTEYYISNSGRFGTNQFNEIEKNSECIANYIRTELTSNRILVIGHGENIFIPSRIASYLNADFRTTSRSPIFISNENNYPIKTKHRFFDRDVEYFLYDKDFIEEYYDEVVFLTETENLDIKLCKNCKIFRI